MTTTPELKPDLKRTVIQSADDLRVALAANSYVFHGWSGYPDHTWEYRVDGRDRWVNVFEGEKISLNGPDAESPFFSRDSILGPIQYVRLFTLPEVQATIRKFRALNEPLACRIAFLLGGIARFLCVKPNDASSKEVQAVVSFVARTIMLSDEHSADADAMAMVMNIISGGSIEDNRQFAGSVFRMTEAIRADPVVPKETADLGLSQLARLRAFVDLLDSPRPRPFPDIGENLTLFEGFPTVGGEFHFPSTIPQERSTFWQRLAIMNMAQYQRGSSIPLSRRIDHDIIEVRMNPSTFPIAVATWKYMRLLLPELNHAYFFVTLGRQNRNFSWVRDGTLLGHLKALGLLLFASAFQRNPVQDGSGEVKFGEIYLGQTVRLIQGKYMLIGSWSFPGGSGFGQVGIYTGFGDIFPSLAYFLSMVVQQPKLLTQKEEEILSRIWTIDDAFTMHPEERSSLFRTIQDRIERDVLLNAAFKSGKQLIEILSP